jgi:thiol:disulfide interchange protein DsbD
LQILLAILFAGLSLGAHAAHTQARLILAAETARPGDTVLAGIHLQMDAGWHTYWRNPGDSGMATKIVWSLPPGVTAGEIQWPVPYKLTDSDLTTYIFTNEVMLLVPLTLASNLPAGPLDLKAKVAWLECQDLCLPGEQEVAATLNVGAETKPSAEAAVIETWQEKLPRSSKDLPIHAYWENSATGDTRPLILALPVSSPFNRDDKFLPDANDDYELHPSDALVPSENQHEIKLRLIVKKFSNDWPKSISGVWFAQEGISVKSYNIQLPVTDNETVIKPVPAGGTPALPAQALSTMLLFAFLGGLILNVMPCVLPVIALKILGFVSQAKENPRRVRQLGLVYAAGVLVSFLVLAGLVIAVKAGGHRASWGMQFSNPPFLVALTALVTLVALNLFGVFEVTLSGRALTGADQLAAKHGASGAFFNGVLATVLATPCTAPFLAPALGFAFTQSPVVIVLFFATIAAGLAAPYVVLSWQPAWLKFLPKPGAWMEKFKIAMGFPMLATVVWLYDVASAFYGDRTWWLGVFLVVLALAAWVFGTFVQRGRTRTSLALFVALVILFAGYGYALEMNLHWRTALTEMPAEPLKTSAEGIDWQPWSAGAVTAARAQGRPVLVDFTARWCSTCRVNKAFALEVPAVQAKLKALNAVALLGDYTHFPEDIAAELARFNRAGVPLVLVYPADASRPPQVLPALLTPGIVLDALNAATTTVSK